MVYPTDINKKDLPKQTTEPNLAEENLFTDELSYQQTIDLLINENIDIDNYLDIAQEDLNSAEQNHVEQSPCSVDLSYDVAMNDLSRTRLNPHPKVHPGYIINKHSPQKKARGSAPLPGTSSGLVQSSLNSPPRHIVTRYPDSDSDSDQPEVNATAPDITIPPPYPYQCRICQQEFTHLTHLKAHELCHDEIDLKTYNKTFREQYYPNQTRQVTAPKKKKPLEQKFKQSLKLAHLNSPQTCDICDKKFMNINLLQNHMMIHGNLDLHEHSPIQYDTTHHREALPKPYPYIHSNERKYPCNICQEEFACKQSLKTHIISHLKGPFYFCKFPDCGAKFSFYSGMQMHISSHIEGPFYFCPVPGCDEKFKHKHGLLEHLLNKGH